MGWFILILQFLYPNKTEIKTATIRNNKIIRSDVDTAISVERNICFAYRGRRSRASDQRCGIWCSAVPVNILLNNEKYKPFLEDWKLNKRREMFNYIKSGWNCRASFCWKISNWMFFSWTFDHESEHSLADNQTLGIWKPPLKSFINVWW